VAKLGDPVAQYLLHRNGVFRSIVDTNPSEGSRSVSAQEFDGDASSHLADEPLVIDAVSRAAPLHAGSSAPDSERDTLRRIFRYDGDKLSLEDHRLKQTSQRDFVRRLTYLFLYAHSLEGRETVPREDLNQLLRDAGVFDSNASSWISSSKDFIKEESDLRIIVPGKDIARKILEEVADPSATGSWDYDSRSRSAAKRTSGDNGEVGGQKRATKKKGSQVEKRVKPWVDAWNAGRGKDITAYEYLQGKSVMDRGLFALWAIRTSSPDAPRRISRDSIAQFLRDACSLKTDGRGLQRQLAKSPHVIHDKTMFEINPGGIKYVADKVGSFESNDQGSTESSE
jgi:hypothetical protein